MKSSALEKISVTLVAPEYPINVGYVARLLKNFGLSRLYLINPKVDMRVAEVYASGGADLIRNAKKTTFQLLRQNNDLLVATTAIRATRKSNVTRMMTPLDDAVKYIRSANSASLVFGRDTTGLTSKELGMCDIVTTVDTGTIDRTLNLSHAASIILYLLSKERAPRKSVNTSEVRTIFTKYVRELAIASGLQKHRLRKLLEISNRIALKSGLNERELSLLVGLNRKALLMVRSGGWRNHDGPTSLSKPRARRHR